MYAGAELSSINVNRIQSKPVKNSQDMNMNKGIFLKMMMLINENHNKQDFNSFVEAGSELNIMNLINTKGMFDLVDLNNVGFNLNEETSSLNEDDSEKKLNSDTSIDKFILMMNHFNPTHENIIFEKLPSESTLTINDKTPMNFNLHNNQLENTQYMSEKTGVSEQLKEITPQPNQRFEKLIAEIEGSRNKKNIIDFNVESILREPLINGENKIVTVSDESSLIKPQVLSQIKDKIVFMAEEGSVSGNKVKQVTMELQPHNLGKVDIKIIFEDNKITVEIKALNEETQKILSSSAGELTKTLGKTTDSPINVVVKNFESHYEQQSINYNHTNAQRYNDDYNHQDGHSRQRNYYNNHDNNKDSDDDSLFSEIINLRNLKLQ